MLARPKIQTLVPAPFMFGIFSLVNHFHFSIRPISVSGAGPLSGSVDSSPPPSPCSPEGTCSCRAIFVYVAGLVTSKTLIASWRARPWSWSTHSPSPLTTPRFWTCSQRTCNTPRGIIPSTQKKYSLCLKTIKCLLHISWICITRKFCFQTTPIV